MLNIEGRLTHFANPVADADRPYPEALKDIICVARAGDAIADIKTWPGYAATPLHRLTSMARAAGLGAIYYKDESQRFSLKSFKALGGAYAVARQLQHAVEARTGRRPSISELLVGECKADVAGLGMQLNEWPSNVPGGDMVLRPGMILTLEPGMTFAPGRMMVHEENIVITESGCNMLHRRAWPQMPVIG